MRMCKTYVDNMWYNIKPLKSWRYSIWADRSVVIKQWIVHELCEAEQTYVHCVCLLEIRARIIPCVGFELDWIIWFCWAWMIKHAQGGEIKRWEGIKG